MSAQASHMQPVLLAPEAERIIENLEFFKIRDVGSKRWMRQHEDLEKLNAQAQYSIMVQSDEFVIEALIDREKISLLLHDLIVIEVWKEKVFPEIKEELGEKHSTKTYFIFYHEAIILGLLEKAFFHKSACGAGGELTLDLADYIYRKLLFLATADKERVGPDPTAIDDDLPPHQILERQKEQVDFGCAISCLTLLRYLTENTSDIPLGVLTRLLEEQDVLLVLVPLLENPPWKRINKGKYEKFSEGRWTVVEKADLPRLTKTEAQVWLALNNLICDPQCKQKYKWTDYTKSNVLRIAKFMNEILLDQLPVLVDLRRALDTLNIQTPADSGPTFLIQQVPELRDNILRSESNWRTVADEILANALRRTTEEERQELSRLAAAYGSNDFEEFMEEPKCVACGKAAEKRCSRCKIEWYCSRECQVQSWKSHKQFCDLIVSSADKK